MQEIQTKFTLHTKHRDLLLPGHTKKMAYFNFKCGQLNLAFQGIFVFFVIFSRVLAIQTTDHFFSIILTC